MTGTFDLDTLARLAGDKSSANVPCPLCGPDKRTSAGQRKPVLKIWRVAPEFATYNCVRCGEHGHALDRSSKPIDRAALARRMAAADAHHQAEAAKRRDLARWLWRQSRPAGGTIVAAYLKSRGIQVLPPTLRFLPARGEHAPAMLAAFGHPSEPEPGVYDLGRAGVAGIHITRLKSDGSGKAPDAEGRSKIMVGPSAGWPLALVPPNDAGGIVIAEGIENALTLHQAAGLGAWAAGAAGRLPKLAPLIARLPFVEAVSIGLDDDATGRRHAGELAGELHWRRPDIEVRLWEPMGALDAA